MPFAFGHGQAAARLSAEFSHSFPSELMTYLDRVAPAADVEFSTVGNPLYVYGLDQLSMRQPGYSWYPTTDTPFAGWPASFFLLGDERADPVLLHLDQPEAGTQKLWHGAGSFCSAALHHALTAFEPEPIIRDVRRPRK